LSYSDTTYLTVFGVIAFWVVVRFGRKDKAAIDDVEKSLPSSSAKQERDEVQSLSDERFIRDKTKNGAKNRTKNNDLD